MADIPYEELWMLFKTKEEAVCFSEFCEHCAEEITGEGFCCQEIIETYSGFLIMTSAESLFRIFDAGTHVYRLISGFYENHPSVGFLARYISEGGVYLKFEAEKGKLLIYDADSQWWQLDFGCYECGRMEEHLAIRYPKYAGKEYCCPKCGCKSVFDMSYELEEYEFVENELKIRELTLQEYEEERSKYNLTEAYSLFEKLIKYCKEEGRG